MSGCARLAGFVAVGATAALVNLAARALIDRATSYEAAVVLAFPIALATAFLLNRSFVFDAAAGRWQGQFGRFALVNLLALAQVFAVSVALARWLLPAVDFTWHADTVAHAVGVASPILTSYWAHSRFTFAGSSTAERHA
jgi:putative flippase GtrA